jgi:uncharacterized repeat protein (TIGR03803 family)
MAVQRLLTMLLMCGAYSAAQNPPPTLTTLYSFTCCTSYDGYDPVAPPTVGAGGVLYGTTSVGGRWGQGAVFSLTPPSSPGGAWTESILHSFHDVDGISDGINPNTRLVIGSGGVLYGTSYSGGDSNIGTVFSLTPPASPGGHWAEAVYSFSLGPPGGDDNGGQNPTGLTISPTGILFGATKNGGIEHPSNYGTVFALVPPASPGGSWTESVLHRFAAGETDGCYPGAGVTGSGGVLYGTTEDCGSAGYGTVFMLAPPAIPGGAWTETVLYSFGATNDADGSCPFTGVVIGGDGVLYGTTAYGGSSGYGTVYSLTPPASAGGPWTEAVLHDFPFASGASHPFAWPGPLTVGEDGTIYGTTEYGGGVGAAFALKPPTAPGQTWTEILLHKFTGGADGVFPTGLTMGAGGVLYGTTQQGLGGFGTVFMLTE